jgi:hypothetical protein
VLSGSIVGSSSPLSTFKTALVPSQGAQTNAVDFAGDSAHSNWRSLAATAHGVCPRSEQQCVLVPAIEVGCRRDEQGVDGPCHRSYVRSPRVFGTIPTIQFPAFRSASGDRAWCSTRRVQKSCQKHTRKGGISRSVSAKMEVRLASGDVSPPSVVSWTATSSASCLVLADRHGKRNGLLGQLCGRDERHCQCCVFERHARIQPSHCCDLFSALWLVVPNVRGRDGRSINAGTGLDT